MLKIGGPFRSTANRREAMTGAIGNNLKEKAGKALISQKKLSLSDQFLKTNHIFVNKRQQVTDHLLMVRPAHFGYNEQTAASNAFQSRGNFVSADEIGRKALEEFDAFVALLRSKSIQVTVVDDSPDPVKPDAIFPNNWISFHQNGYIITYPMQAEVRRLERHYSIIDDLAERFNIKVTFPLEESENYEQYLEGTGSMVFDRVNKIAYACLSPRTHEATLDKFCRLTGFKKVVFNAVDQKGQAIYHTNVMMALGEDFVVICLETVKDPEQRKLIKQHFADTGKAIIRISLDQMMAYAGNMLQVRNNRGQRFLVMSTRAYQSLYPEQIQLIEQYSGIIHSPIPTIETVGGGSVRCMMAEVFLVEKEGAV